MSRISLEVKVGRVLAPSYGEGLDARKKGEVIHLALSFVDTVEDFGRVDLFVKRAVSILGWGTEPWDLEEEFVCPIKRALSLPEALPFFSKDARLVLKERDFLFPNPGSEPIVLRPDRVVVYGKKALVVDYKMSPPTSKEVKDLYRDQVRRYMEVVERTFGLPVEGYLFYILTPEVLRV